MLFVSEPGGNMKLFVSDPREISYSYKSQDLLNFSFLSWHCMENISLEMIAVTAAK